MWPTISRCFESQAYWDYNNNATRVHKDTDMHTSSSQTTIMRNAHNRSKQIVHFLLYGICNCECWNRAGWKEYARASTSHQTSNLHSPPLYKLSRNHHTQTREKHKPHGHPALIAHNKLRDEALAQRRRRSQHHFFPAQLASRHKGDRSHKGPSHTHGRRTRHYALVGFIFLFLSVSLFLAMLRSNEEGSQERGWNNSEQWCGVGQQRRGRR